MKAIHAEPTHIRITIELLGDNYHKKSEGDTIPLPLACDENELKLCAFMATGNAWAKLPEPVKMNKVIV